MKITAKTLQAHLVELRPPRLAFTLLALAVIAHWLLPLAVWRAPAWLAAAVAATGLLVMLRGWWLFRLAGTPICPTDHATVLVTHDIYAHTRNPMYLGILSLLAGAALLAGTLGFYVAALAFFAVIDSAFCPFEERRLLASFGDAYHAYARKVRRWV